MLARIRKSMEEKDQGFTLIELLVVMIIIGILAAIAIPVFLNQRKKAEDSATKADVSTVGKEIATYFVDNTTAPASAVAKSASGQYEVNGVAVGRASDNVVVHQGAVTGWTSDAWCVSLTNPKGTGADAAARAWKYSAQSGLQKGACASATAP